MILDFKIDSFFKGNVFLGVMGSSQLEKTKQNKKKTEQ